MPFYVGKASRTVFKTETLNGRNRRAFTAALIRSFSGARRTYILSYCNVSVAG